MDGDGSSSDARGGYGSYSDSNDGNDATAYGGRYANGTGFDPSYKTIGGQDLGKFGDQGGWATAPQEIGIAPPVNYQQQLATMFNKDNPDFKQNLNAMQSANTPMQQWSGGLGSMYGVGPEGNSPEQNADAGQALRMASMYGTSNPSLMTRLGVMPGVTKEGFFNQNTPEQQADRMGIFGDAIGAVGKTLIGGMMPAPMRMGLAGMSAYNNYQQNGNMQQAAGRLLGAMPGYAGAAGQAMQGNYGGALSSVAGLNGVGGLESRIAGMGLDASLGKNVTSPAMGLAGMYMGNRLGGPVGGVFGGQLGRTMAHIKGYK